MECCPVVKSVHYLEALQTNVKFLSTLNQTSIKRLSNVSFDVFSLPFLVTMRLYYFKDLIVQTLYYKKISKTNSLAGRRPPVLPTETGLLSEFHG